MANIYKVKTSDQILTSMKQYLVGQNSKLTNFNTGSRNLTILEAVSLVSAATQNDFFQALKKAIPVAIYDGFNFTRKAGTQASGELEFIRNQNATQDYSIPIGTSMLLNGIEFTTIEAGTILTGAKTSGNVLAQASVVGDDGNIGVGEIDTQAGLGSFVNQPTGVEHANNPTAFSGGTETETDDERASRFRDFVLALAKSPVSGILAGVRSIDGIKSVTVVENSPSNGWVTIYADDGTGTLSPAKQSEIEDLIRGIAADFENYPGYKAAGIRIHVQAPTITLINITSTMDVLDSSLLTNTELEALATTAIQDYTNTLALGQDWIISEVITAVQNAHSDIYDFEISSPASNVSISDGFLAKTNTIDITTSRVTP